MEKIVLTNTASQIIGKALGAVTTLVVTIIVARNFGTQGYGDFVKVTTFVAFFYLLVDFGMNAIFLQHDTQKYWPSLVVIRILTSIGLMAISYLIILVLPGTDISGYTPIVKRAIILFSPTIFFQAMITTSNAIFQKKLRYELSAWAIFFGSITTIVLLWKPVDLSVVLIAYVIGVGVTALSSYYFATRLLSNIQFSFNFHTIKQLLLPSLPLGVTLLFNLVYFRADSIIITLTRPTAEVGIYGLAYKVFEVVLVLPTFFMNATYPLLLNQQNFKKTFDKALLFLFLISCLMLPFIWFAAPLLTLIKSDFAPSIGALRVLSLGLPLYFLTSAFMWALITKKKQRSLVYIYGFSMLVNIFGNMMVVPLFGFIAASWMTIVGEAIILLLSVITFFYKK